MRDDFGDVEPALTANGQERDGVGRREPANGGVVNAQHGGEHLGVDKGGGVGGGTALIHAITGAGLDEPRDELHDEPSRGA